MSTPSQQGPDHQLGPMPPMPDGQPSGPPSRPRAVDLAFILALVGTAFDAVVVAVTVLTDSASLREITRQALQSSGQTPSETDIANAMNLMRVSTVVAVLVVCGLALLFALKMRAGRNWARILLTVLAAFNVLSFLTSAGTIGLGLDFLWNAISVGLSVATVVYLFRAESNAYFVAAKQRR